MKSYIPGTMSPAYLAELKRLQDQLLDSITEDPCETQYRDACYKKWVESCFPRGERGTGS